MTALPKHLRPRWRYLAVGIEAWPDADLDRRSLQAAVWRSARHLLGDPGSADADLKVLRFRFDRGIGEAVVRTRRDEVEAGRAAMACIDAVEGQPVGIRIRGVSGTVRACEEKYLGSGPELRDTNVAFESVDRRAVARDDLIDVRLDDAYVGATRLDIE
jgi:ribonuclease P/MRP protein subunit POP5